MRMEPVSSSQVAALGWENDVLVVRFTTGAVYAYSNVPYTVYQEVKNAPSIGHALNECLKYNENYPCTKLTD